MRHLGLAVALLLATSAAVAAEELYVPLAGGASRTEVQIVNAAAHRAFIELERLGETPMRIELDAGESVRWADGGSDDLGVLRISGDAMLRVTAVSHSGGASVTAPVLAATHTVEEAAVPVRTDSRWRSGIMIVNPGDTPAVVTIDGAVHVLEPRGVLRGTTFSTQTPLLVFAYDINDATGARVFTAITPQATRRKRRAVRSATPAPQVQTVVLTPSKDNTLFESTNGGTSNGAGVHLFAGATQTQAKRRALLAFDVASQIPPGSRITRVTLTLRVSLTVSGAEPMTLHRVSADWGEGTSNAGVSRDGGGATSHPGDATWVHTFFPDRRWSAAGGDFDAAVDATAQVAALSGVWESAAMIARVQQWLDQPATNFGWIVIGNETRGGTAKRFDSREMQPDTSRPSLTIEFQR